MASYKSTAIAIFVSFRKQKECDSEKNIGGHNIASAAAVARARAKAVG